MTILYDPQKSIRTTDHGRIGGGDMLFLETEIRPLQNFFTCLSMLTNHTFSLLSCFVLTIPW